MGGKGGVKDCEASPPLSFKRGTLTCRFLKSTTFSRLLYATDKERLEFTAFDDIYDHRNPNLMGLTEKTINNHLANIDFYVNEYLLYYDATEVKDGAHSVGEFLGH